MSQQTALQFMQQFADNERIKEVLYAFTAKIYHDVGHYNDEARCLALSGKLLQAAEIYLSSNQVSKGIECLIKCNEYEKALEETRKWKKNLDDNDISGHVKSRLFLACCLIMLNKEEDDAQNAYIEAREIIESEEYRKGCLSGNIWEYLGEYGQYISRDDLIRIGYEKAIEQYESCNKSEWKRAIEAYIKCVSSDYTLVYELQNKLELSLTDEEQELPQTISNSIGMTFALIPDGVFMMGSPEDEPGRYDDEILHEVTISKSFYMQTTSVTQGQWENVMKNNPSEFKDEGKDCPVENVSWDDTQEFIKKLNQLEETDKYRLPTEAQWEYACRAGTDSPFYFGKCLSTDQANYDGNYPLSNCPKGEDRNKTIPVGSFEPNAYGLYDMHGNVYDWCQDWYGEYPTTSVLDPTGSDKGDFRVLRGGSWAYYARYCRSAFRSRSEPASRGDISGFRLVFCPRSTK